jgi:hypothetical protein
VASYTPAELSEILAKHAEWLRGAAGGTRAYLTGADLAGANLTDANLTDADLTGAYLTGADLAGANLTDAYLAGAYLTGANLTDAYLADADLTGADLAGANLTDAYLAGADLAGANLRGANLAGANLRGADLAGANLAGAEWEATPEEIERLDAVREIVLAKPERLRMSTWHSDEWTPDHTPEEERTCGSAHCIAGWLQALSSDPAIRMMDAEAAGRKLAPVASGLFYADDDTVLGWFKERMYANGAAV